MDHATQFSQQFLRIPNAKDENEIRKVHRNTHFFENVEYTLDILFALIAMNFHLLLSLYGRKATADKWSFRYFEDAHESYDHERKLKENCKQLLKQYFDLSNHNRGAIRLWKQNISEFRQSWV